MGGRVHMGRRVFSHNKGLAIIAVMVMCDSGVDNDLGMGQTFWDPVFDRVGQVNEIKCTQHLCQLGYLVCQLEALLSPGNGENPLLISRSSVTPLWQILIILSIISAQQVKIVISLGKITTKDRHITRRSIFYTSCRYRRGTVRCALFYAPPGGMFQQRD